MHTITWTTGQYKFGVEKDELKQRAAHLELNDNISKKTMKESDTNKLESSVSFNSVSQSCIQCCK